MPKLLHLKEYNLKGLCPKRDCSPKRVEVYFFRCCSFCGYPLVSLSFFCCCCAFICLFFRASLRSVHVFLSTDSFAPFFLFHCVVRVLSFRLSTSGTSTSMPLGRRRRLTFSSDSTGRASGWRGSRISHRRKKNARQGRGNSHWYIYTWYPFLGGI